MLSVAKRSVRLFNNNLNLKGFSNMVEQLPKFYAEACEEQPEEYSNYQAHDIKFG